MEGGSKRIYCLFHPHSSLTPSLSPVTFHDNGLKSLNYRTMRVRKESLFLSPPPPPPPHPTTSTPSPAWPPPTPTSEGKCLVKKRKENKDEIRERHRRPLLVTLLSALPKDSSCRKFYRWRDRQGTLAHLNVWSLRRSENKTKQNTTTTTTTSAHTSAHTAL